MQDRNLNWAKETHREKAMRILSESAAYGVAMFPDADTSGKGKSREDWVMGAGDEIVRERARARRKELEEEDRLEDELRVAKAGELVVQSKFPTETTKKLGGSKNLEKGASRGKDSNETKSRRPRGDSKYATRQRLPPEVDYSDIGSSNPDSDTPVTESIIKRPTRTRKARKNGDESEIDLCSSSSSVGSSHQVVSKVKVKKPGMAENPRIDFDSNIHDRSNHTRRSRSKSVASTSDVEPLPPKGASKRSFHQASVVISSDEEGTPRARKLKPPSAVSSKSSLASITQDLRPLNIAKDRREQE